MGKMYAAVVSSFDEPPRYQEFDVPKPTDVRRHTSLAAQLVRSRSSVRRSSGLPNKRRTKDSKGAGYGMRRPLIARATTRRWISLVPSNIVKVRDPRPSGRPEWR
jgi:hypothetical protein